MQQFTQLQLHIQKYAKHIQYAELKNNTGLSAFKKFH